MATKPDESYDHFDKAQYKQRELLKHLLASIPCAVCQRHYKPNEIEIVDHHEEIWIVAVKCSHCGTMGLVFALIKEEKPEVVSDLIPQEWAKFKEMPQIDADDLLDVHEFLSGFDGDFVGLFEGEAVRS